MIYLIGESLQSDDTFIRATFDQLLRWMSDRKEVQVDMETVPAKWWTERKLRTIQFGDRTHQFVVQWSALTDHQKEVVKQWLEDEHLLKIIHNALFECTIGRFYDIRISGIFDTILAEKVLYGGDQEIISYGLDDVCYRRLGISLDKSYQTSFEEDTLTPEMIRYAAQDVTWLEDIKAQQLKEGEEKKLLRVFDLENSVIRVFSEMIYHGMAMDVKHWRSLEYEAGPLVAEAQRKLNQWLSTEEFIATAYDLGYLSDEDRILVNWNSHKQLKHIFSNLYPRLPGTSKAVLRKYLSDRIKEAQEALISAYQGEVGFEPEDYPEWLPAYLDGDTEPLQYDVITHHRDWLIEEGFLIPAGQATINWNSVAQVLPVFQCVSPKIKDLSAETLGRVGHGIIADYHDFKDTYKLLSSYGEKFIRNHVGPDGKVRTDFNPVLVTGRTSSSNPNMQNIPAKENVGNKYRRAFIPPEGWKFVSSDFVSQELVVIAYLSEDPVWLEALAKGQDLHSVTAELVYKEKWRKAADKDCAYYATGVDGKPAHKKCKCARHKWMRSDCKTINFGLVYGVSHFKLASEMRISVPEAQQIIKDYFHAFPRIKALLDYLGTFGVEKGYIQTIYPFFRKRYFHNWKYYIRFIDAHLQGISYHGGLGEIERASKNMPVQGSSADMMKVALIKAYEYIHSHNLEDKVHMVMQVHDQLDCVAREDYAPAWAVIQNSLMEDAGKVVIPTGILKSETTVTDRWQK